MNKIFDTLMPKLLAGGVDCTTVTFSLVSSDDIDFTTASVLTDISDIIVDSANATMQLLMDGNTLVPTNDSISIPITGTIQTIGCVVSDVNGNLLGYVEFGNIRELTDTNFILSLPSMLFRFRTEVN